MHALGDHCESSQGGESLQPKQQQAAAHHEADQEGEVERESDERNEGRRGGSANRAECRGGAAEKGLKSFVIERLDVLGEEVGDGAAEGERQRVVDGGRKHVWRDPLGCRSPASETDSEVIGK